MNNSTVVSQPAEEGYKLAVTRALESIREKPELEKFTVLKQALLRFIDFRFSQLEQDSNTRVSRLREELESMSTKQRNVSQLISGKNAQIDELKAELGRMREAAAVAREAEDSLKKKAEFYEESMGVIDSVNRRLAKEKVQ
jgi:small-conductance mechanosensitive channel